MSQLAKQIFEKKYFENESQKELSQFAKGLKKG